jgi:L-iditol 2-dehydrogenase
VHYYATGRIGSQVVRYPYRVGHEFSATVMETGGAVRNLKPGMLVAVDPAMPCGRCDQCRAGRAHTCRHIRFLGCPGQAQGCLCERVVMPSHCCFPVGNALSPESAALCEPLSIGMYAVNLSVPMAGAKIGVLGCGPIGLSVMLPAIAQGAAVFATDRIDARLDVARRAGARWTGNPDRRDIVAAILAEEPLQLDAVFECCGKQEAIDQAVKLIKPGGKLMFVGIPEADRISFQMDLMRRHELCIQNVRRQNGFVQPTIDALAAGRLKPEFMVTHRFSLEEAGEAFDTVSEYADGVIKAMVYPGS